ncbi:triacylglycerol lipase [Dyella jiangningensis]|uniref:esterase/lipase family protein n=1 Tax=Dyella sp. AtDHG13 TaxID=1938897 RepID=UPI0008888773|nr:hypothetical protein [Dyella sp. AtDHG13]PXV61735.1 triacylglycerol lipase [Dyella sp. AtDHG13]SDJ65656.1 triacylglycerol lipase [Dyella jiangningensis]
MSSKDFRNRYPIILVHGFTGWGRDEMLGFKYWGGKVDIEARLNDLHFHTRTATVGPFSSSWERSVELYHYLVGGRVDYGAAHAKKYGVHRYGHTFPGIYPQISDTNKVHLVGHSMGGQTICDLEAFLRNGSQEERDYHKAHPEEDPISDLFLGGKHWVHSITGLAPGFNGTTFLDTHEGLINFMNLTKQITVTMAATIGGDPNDFIYDYKLDQWGLKREPGEPFVQYQERVFESDVWKSKNIGFYDLTSPGAAKIARDRLRLFPETYYFSFSGNATFKNPKTGLALPVPTINPILYLPALIIGRNQGNPEYPGDEAEWHNNDGCISCAGTRYVLGQEHRDADPNDLSFPPGIWNSFPTMNGWDHGDFTGINISFLLGRRDIMPFYTDLARRLVSIEPPHDDTQEDSSAHSAVLHAPKKHDAAHKAAPAKHAKASAPGGHPKGKH